MDKIIYPKELGMVLEPSDIFNLEQSLKSSRQINQDTFIYIDDENNVRMRERQNISNYLNGSVLSTKIHRNEILEDIISEFTEHMDLADPETSAESGISHKYPDRNKDQTMPYEIGQPPRRAYNTYTDTNPNLRTIGKKIT